MSTQQDLTLKKDNIGLVHVYTGAAKGKCLRCDNSRVLSTIGYNNIISFYNDKKKDCNVLNCNILDHNLNLKTPIYFYNNNIDQCYSIKTKAGYEISSTINHKYLTLNQETLNFEWKKIKDLKTGDRIALARNSNIWGKENIDKNISKYIGILIADGSRSKKTPKEYRLCLVTKNINLISFLREYSNLATGRECKINFSRTRNIYYINWNRDIYSYLLNKYELDISKTSDTKIIPELFMRTNRETTIAFLEGLFTDITIQGSNKSLSISYVCTNPELSKQVKLLLLNLGIVTSSAIKRVKTKKFPNGKNYYSLNIRGFECKNFINIFDIPKITQYVINHKNFNTCHTNIDTVPIKKYLINNIKNVKYNSEEYHLLRNCRSLIGGIGYVKLKKYYEITKDQNVKKLIDLNFFWDYIETIKDDGLNLTCDLVIPDSNSYISNGFVTHNTSLMTGMMCRALNYKKNIFLARFLKNNESGEVEFLKPFLSEIIETNIPADKIIIKKHIESGLIQDIKNMWEVCIDRINSGQFDMICLDEILVCLDFGGIIPINEFCYVINNKPDNLEIILTGRMAKEHTIMRMKVLSRYFSKLKYDDFDDGTKNQLFTKLKCYKHPGQEFCSQCGTCFGDIILAREGIEY